MLGKEMDSKWENVKNSTDIRGVVIKNSERDVNLIDSMISSIAKAFVLLLSRKKNRDLSKLKISIGMDSRITSESIKEILISEIKKLGCTVMDCGLCSTPAMFMSTIFENYKSDGAIEITASHLPYYYNGFKFFTNKGGFDKEDINELLDIAQNEKVCTVQKLGAIIKCDLMKDYSNFLINKIIDGIDDKEHRLKPLENFKIVVDAGNGAGGFFVEKVLNQLGADTNGSQFIEPDGTFPNHIPNPEKKEAMDSLKKAVLENKADIGIIFDTDVDRAAIVDSYGREINRNLLIALTSAIVLEEHQGSIIVTDSVTSNGLKKFIEKRGGIHHRFKRGYRNVINEAIKFNNESRECHFAIETSGHAALKENYFLDDGAYLVCKILIKMARLKNDSNGKLSDLISDLDSPCESKEYRMKIKFNDFKEYGSNILDNLKDYVKSINGWGIEPENYEGIKVNCNKENGDGWFLLRLSLHEAVMPLNIESDSQGGVEFIVPKLIKYLMKYDKLDLSSIIDRQ
ncbi:phosphomannomutase/phosphoglucomutase [Clostridium tyrobutyricum]|uniref:phosphomannomutase/phosphoglucomutase n=1 Tax=Clostridium tyrobutyricum TaxID=1519 RepID=UPI001C394027|nr:phosphomannomutase/phosphoglucomutase [Clostridium tyrobutyricum]